MKWREFLLLFGIIALGFACPACTPLRYATHPRAFDTKSLESGLHRGISSMDDVQRLLGKPDGTGTMLLPADSVPKTTWIYEKLDFEFYRGMTVQQAILLVFFKGDLFDGFIWFSDDPAIWRGGE